MALRSKIVLACAEGEDNKTVAERLRCSANTVSKWRRRFIEHRLDGLLDEERPGWPRTISVDQVEDVIVATLESTPSNATHWSRARMAQRTGLSKTTIGKIWKDFGLKPHRVDHFKLSTDLRRPGKSGDLLVWISLLLAACSCERSAASRRLRG